MAKILKDENQEKAFIDIGNYLNEIGRLNSVLASAECDFKLYVNGGKSKFDIAPEKAVQMLRDRKKDLVKNARKIAKDFRIGFDEKDELAMSDDFQKTETP